MYDVIIIGRGPAGISASLYTVRANLKTLVIGMNDSALGKSEKIENYYGFENPISGEYLLQQGVKQAARLGAVLVEESVIAIEQGEFFEVITAGKTYTGKAVLLATGQPQKKLKVGNIKEFEGKGISYCSTCDGFFYKELRVGVMGYNDYAIHEALELEAFTKDITLFTNGMELEVSEKNLEEAGRFKVNTRPVLKVDGGEFLERIYFKDGTFDEIDGIFIAYESASSVDFANKMGILTEGNSVIVDANMETNLRGLFAAGDCTGGFKQISTAVGQGALAGKRIIEYVRSL